MDSTPDRLRKKRELFESLSNLDASDEEPDPGREASEKAWRTRIKSPSARAAVRSSLARAISDKSVLQPVSSMAAPETTIETLTIRLSAAGALDGEV